MEIELKEQDFRKYLPSNALLNVELASKIKDVVFINKMKGYLYNHPNANVSNDTIESFKKLWVFYIYEKLLIDESFQLKNSGVNRVTSTTTSPANIEEIKMKLKNSRAMTYDMANELLSELNKEIEDYKYKNIQDSYFSGWFVNKNGNKC